MSRSRRWMPNPSCASILHSSECLGNDYIVPVFQQDILLGVLAFDHFFVVELQTLAISQYYNLFRVGELPEAPGCCQGVQNVSRNNQRECPCAAYLTSYIVLLTVYLIDRYGHFWVLNVIRERLLNIARKLIGGTSGSLDLPDQRQGNLAVRPDQHRA